MACISKRRGRWVIDFYDQKGKRRWKTLKKGITKGQAKEELRAIEDQISKGIYLPLKKIPKFSQVAGDWLEYKEPNLRASSLKMYRGHLKYHFNEVNDLKINRISTAKVEKFITGKQVNGMNLTTLRKIIVTFNQVMNYAVRHKYIDHNPVREAERPRDQGDDIEAQDLITILTPDQLKAFLDAEKDRKHKTLFRMAVFSGARQGEILGLKWSDVDWENSQIHIQRTFNYGHFFLPKTKTSKRKIDLGPATMAALKEWRLACPKNDLDLVFPNNSGNPMDHGNLLNRHFYPALKAAGIPRIRFHDLRHTYASLLIEQGENIKYIQTQLGHSSPTVTLNVYAHLMKPVNQEAARRLEETVFGTDGSKMVAEREPIKKKGHSMILNPLILFPFSGAETQNRTADTGIFSPNRSLRKIQRNQINSGNNTLFICTLL